MRFLFVIDDFAGHLTASAGLARRLAGAGHKTLFLASPESGLLLQGLGVSHRAEPWMTRWGPSRPFWETLRRRRETARERQAILAEAQASVRRAVDEFQPDLVVIDPFVLFTFPFFWRLGVRCVALSSKPLLSFDPLVPPYTTAFAPRGERMDRWRVGWLWARQWGKGLWAWADDWFWSLIIGASPLTDYRMASRRVAFPLRRYWRGRPVAFDRRFKSVPEIVLWPKEFDLPRRWGAPDDAFFVGGCHNENDAGSADVQALLPQGDGPLIYCSLGTVRRVADPNILMFYRAVVAALLEDSKIRLVLVTGVESEASKLVESLPSLPDHIRIVGLAPQRDILPKVDLLITHGGTNSIKEAIAHDVPMLVFPRRADQPGCAARVAFHGLGAARSIDKATPASLRQDIVALLGDPTLTRRVAAMRQAFERYDQENVAVMTMERLVGLARSRAKNDPHWFVENRRKPATLNL